MRKIVAFALGTAVVLGDLGAFGVAAYAQETRVVRERGQRPVVIIRPDQPYWDSYIVPRYRYRPEDDRVDPCGGPVVPVINYGAQEIPIAPEVAAQWGLGRIVGRDYPCGVRRR